jgi:ABC-type glutathione transport system ATPase component
VEYPLLLQGGATRQERAERVTALLEAVGIGGYGRHRPSELSGGQRQRVGIARALASGARIIVCDEAVSALDVSVRARVLNLIARLRRELDVAFVFISHDISVVAHLSDRILVMQSGRVVEQGRTREVIDAPTSDYTRQLVAAVPELDPC